MAPRVPARAGTNGAPSAFSFGPHHLEVLHTDQAGLLRRLYAEGARPDDDPATAPAGGWQLSTPPASDARASTTIHCVARGGDGHLHHVAYEDGFWSEWTDLGGSVAGDPVAVAPSPGVLDVAVRQADNSVALRRLAADGWSPWSATNWQTPDDLVGFPYESETRLVLRGFDGHLYEGAVQWDGSWRQFRDIGGRASTRPHVVRVADDNLPWPHGGIPATTAAVPAGIYLFFCDAIGTTECLWLSAGGWMPFVPFGAAQVARPIHVPFEDGSAVASTGQPLGFVSQAGWLGRTAAGQIQATAAWWQEHVLRGFVSYTALNTMPWTTVGPPMDGDPIGLTFTAVDPLDPAPPTTFAFARLPGGTIMVASLLQLAPAAAPSWTVFGSGDGGDAALLQLWERFDDADLLHAVMVDPQHYLAHRAGGFAAEQPRAPPDALDQPAGPDRVRGPLQAGASGAGAPGETMTAGQKQAWRPTSCLPAAKVTCSLSCSSPASSTVHGGTRRTVTCAGGRRWMCGNAERRTLNPRVRRSSPGRCTRSDLAFLLHSQCRRRWRLHSGLTRRVRGHGRAIVPGHRLGLR